MDGSVSLNGNDITVKCKHGVNLFNDFLEVYGEDYTIIETIKGEFLAKIPTDYVAIPSTISEKGAIVAYDFDFKGTTTYYRYADFDFRTQSVGKTYCTERLPGGLIYSNSDLFIFKTKENLWAFSLQNQNELWHFDVSALGRYREWYPEGPEHPGVVTKFLGVWQGRLYVAVSNGLVIELELESGLLLRSWQQLPDGITLPPSGWDKLHGLELAFLDDAAGEIACITHQYYWRIDLESGALQFHDLREHFSAAQLQVSPPAGDLAFDAEHIYFASEFRQYDGQPRWFRSHDRNPLSARLRRAML